MKNINYAEIRDSYKDLTKEQIDDLLLDENVELRAINAEQRKAETPNEELIIEQMAKVAVLDTLSNGEELPVELLDIDALQKEVNEIPIFMIQRYFRKLAQQIDEAEDVYEIIRLSAMSTLLGRRK